MKFRPFALLACAALVVGLSACQEDPTEGNVGVPEAIIADRSETHRSAGTAFTITAYVVDKNLQRIPGKIEAAPAGAAVTVDSAIYDAVLTQTRIYLKANAATTGTNVTLSGHGLTKDVSVVIS